MSIVKTTEDGWGCVPQLKNAALRIAMLRDHVYEIKYCVRASNLEYMISEMKELLQDAMDELDEIDPKLEFKTVEIED